MLFRSVARARQTIGNQVVVPLRGGAITIYASMPTHVVVDLGGWYTGPSAPAGGDGLFVPLVPGRLLDTRDRTNSPLLGMKPAANDTIDVTATGRNTIPASGVAAVVVTAVVTNSDAAGFLTFFGAGLGRPPTSNLNTDSPGRTIANHAVVPVSTAGLSDLKSTRLNSSH